MGSPSVDLSESWVANRKVVKNIHLEHELKIASTTASSAQGLEKNSQIEILHQNAVYTCPAPWYQSNRNGLEIYENRSC